MTNEELLRKATHTLADFGGAGEAPLTIEQVRQFLRLAITPQIMLPDVRTVTSNANKWQESKIDFSSRIMRPGIEGERLSDGNRVKPTTGIVEISTVLVRGEVPVTDEVLEDQVEQAGYADTLMAMIAEAVGRDLEELAINGDTTSGDAYLALLNGWIYQARNGTGANTYNGAGDAQDYQKIFRNLVNTLPDRFKRDIPNMRLYVPLRLEERYRDILANRGTPLGDLILMGNNEIRYQSILVKGVPMMTITAGTPDTSNVLLTHRMNLYFGIRRAIRLESFRDPREGQTSFIVTCRADAEIAHIPATALAYSVDVEPN